MLRSETRIGFVLKTILLIEAIASLWNRQWLTAVTTFGIIALTMMPILLRRRFKVHITAQFELMAIGFVFASLFLGEVRNYYIQYWWWDIALHTTSGLLLGIIGFLLVHILNQMDDISLRMKPGFVAFFAFLFAVGTGALWEIFEFAMDSFFGTNMQKPMLNDPSGLTDTMWDLIVDTLGALVIAIIGYFQIRDSRRKPGFIRVWIANFVNKNPTMFKVREKTRKTHSR